MLQRPTVSSVTELPETVQMDMLFDVKLTVRPEPEIALSATGPLVSGVSDSGSNEIVCGLLVTLKLFVTWGAAWSVLEALLWSTPAGWASLAVAVLLLSGVQLLMLGLIGEYLGRLFLTANRKPQAIIREVTHAEPSATPAHQRDERADPFALRSR